MVNDDLYSVSAQNGRKIAAISNWRGAHRRREWRSPALSPGLRLVLWCDDPTTLSDPTPEVQLQHEHIARSHTLSASRQKDEAASMPRRCETTEGAPRESTACSSVEAVRLDQMHRHENAFLSAKGDFRKLKLIRNGRKIAPRFPRCGIELGYLAFGNRISIAVKQYEDRNWSASMASTTLAMVPVYCFRVCR